ncbi:MAG: galactose-1-phosphate uridylyltransferase [Planctomycetes bacterium RBG_13_62_9]|nr:MAG: galactose-1-phosphate uridylyltransferase [Planctomycetes bacterium RBG_13_62_9]
MNAQSTLAGEIRQNIVTDRWVIYTPERANRPGQVRERRTRAAYLPDHDAGCPFCAGNEEMLPSIVFELAADSDGLWHTRIVPNKYPVLTSETDVAGTNRGIHLVTTNYGRHEIIIESPFHNRDLPVMAHEEIEAVVETYARRHSELYGMDESIQSVLIFRNHGEQAGTSIRHPHSQVVASGIVPEFVARRERIAEGYFQQNHRCILCDVVDLEQMDRARVIYENASFLLFVPFAAEVPFELWIAPTRHSPDFGLISRLEKEHFALALQDALQILHDRLDDPDYNCLIHSYSRQHSIVPYLHWYLQIRPHLIPPSGFEIGSGMQVNSSLPEHDAEVLRQEV